MSGKETQIMEAKSLSNAIGMADSILKKDYLSELASYEVVRGLYPGDTTAAIKDTLNASVRFFDITKVVLNKNENMRDKLVSVFNAVWNTGASLLLQIAGEKERVSIRMGIKNRSGDTQDTMLAQNVLKNSLVANFPGTKMDDPLDADELKKNVLDCFSATQTVAAVTDIAGLRSEEESHEKQFMQGIEKLIDAMQGKTYTLLLIADPVSLSDLNANRRALESVYSQLVPFSGSQYSIGESETASVNESLSVGVTDTISKSIAESVSHTTGTSFTETEGTSRAETHGTSHTVTDGTTNGVSTGTSYNVGSFVSFGGAGMSLGRGVNFGVNHSKSHSVAEGTTHSISSTDSHSISRGVTESNTTGTTTTDGASHADSLNTTRGTGYQTGETRNLQLSFENHTVKQLMERIDKLLDRYDTCADLGMWNCAMYCVSDKVTAEMAASLYRSIIRGKNSALESSAITVWERERTPEVMNSLRHMEHPRLIFGGLRLTPGTLISSSELAIHAGLPNHSVPGIPVIECAEFGRTVSFYDDLHSSRPIELGKIYNMHREEELSVYLDANSLASHTFITGSTGSGKSNTVYHIVDKATKAPKTHFLVIEPAKGEYKHVFGNNANVYGTNPDLAPLLRINPFSFPHGSENPAQNIHILEHLDRLIEIFNVCWPMYAAMPAVLKEAVEKAYEDCGWNLAESTNEYGDDLYPTFADVTRNIRTIIDSSEYDAENKGAYKGSLITRLKSLTNGINGQIFTTDEISDEKLFEENVIVDISRVGSAETKSLIMGLLVLKLQEYRMTSGQMNAPLRHVTVLEEAHNLLKRTSTEQAQDSGNLLGKSVEMLTNSIAEMRTYGEGFIIVDQAPALLDMAVIRNTNTKIIMRLPDKDDRELVGKAANLNDDQITELARLPRGVAAVYQNEWVEAVLCKVTEFETDETPYSYKRNDLPAAEPHTAERLEIARLLFSKSAEESKLKDALNRIRSLKCSGVIYVNAKKYVNSSLEKPDMSYLSEIIPYMFPEFVKTIQSIAAEHPNGNDIAIWRHEVQAHIENTIATAKIKDDEHLCNYILNCILVYYVANTINKPELLDRLNPKHI